MKMQRNRFKSLLLSIQLLSLFPAIVVAQETGIKFETNLSWNEIKAKAKAENKYIFVDCYASWCGPCKYMAQNIFPLKEVGDFMNPKFVSVAVQMDRTGKDADDVKKWYKDAQILQKNYSVYAFPTFLFFLPNGKVIHRFEGATGKEGQAFVRKVSETFIPGKQYYAQNELELAMIKEHRNDSLFLLNAIDTALKRTEYNKGAVILDYYLDCIKAPFQKDNLEIIERTTHFSGARGFKFLLDNHNKIRGIEGSDRVDELLRYRITQDELNPMLNDESKRINWEAIAKKLYAKYPEYAEQVIAQTKPEYYWQRNNIFEFGRAMVEYMDKYQDQLTGYWINQNAWDVFSFCNDRTTLLSAAEWVKKLIDKETVEGYPNENVIDTYANILYKIGEKENAMVWENKALQLANKFKEEPKIKSIKSVLVKMEKGEKTWQ